MPQRSSSSAVAPPSRARSPRKRLTIKPPDERGELWGQDGHGPVEVGKDPAALDVADDDRWNAGPPGQAEVDQVVAQEVDLGRAPGPLADHDVVAGAQGGQGTVDDVDERSLGGQVAACLLLAGRVPHDDDCAARSPVGFSSTGFMATSGSAPAATAWSHWARPISPPSAVTIEFSDMFWPLNGATATPAGPVGGTARW